MAYVDRAVCIWQGGRNGISIRGAQYCGILRKCTQRFCYKKKEALSFTNNGKEIDCLQIIKPGSKYCPNSKTGLVIVWPREGANISVRKIRTIVILQLWCQKKLPHC